MKKLLLLLALAMSLPSLKAGATAETVVVSSSDILAGKAPFTCDVQRRKNGDFAFVLKLNASSPVNGLFVDYDLRVLKAPVSPSTIKDKLFSAEQLAWHRPASQSPMVLAVTENEVPLAYIVASWSLGDVTGGTSRVKRFFFSVQELVSASQGGPTMRSTQQP
jgi:hypothetical protein